MKVFAIAINTFKEAVRNRVLYVLLFFAVLILLAAWVASTLAIFGQEKIVRDLGVAAINIISVLIAVFVGVGLVYNDLDKKTIYTIVSKPISRWHFLIGKYLGLLLTICVNILIMTFFFLAVLYFRRYTTDEVMSKALWMNADGTYKEAISPLAPTFYYLISFVKAIAQALLSVVSFGIYSIPATQGIMAASFLTMLEMSIVTAFAILFSSFASPILSAMMTVIMFVVGRLNQDLYYLADLLAFRAGGVDNLTTGQYIAYQFSTKAAYVAPNLEFFNQRHRIAEMLSPEITGYQIVYGVAYTAVVLVIAIVIFNRRNFK
ncbi:ABC transporter permease subunit [bacterium]|nr:ABC transporter permease subunit [bacterium]